MLEKFKTNVIWQISRAQWPRVQKLLSRTQLVSNITVFESRFRLEKVFNKPPHTAVVYVI